MWPEKPVNDPQPDNPHCYCDNYPKRFFDHGNHLMGRVKGQVTGRRSGQELAVEVAREPVKVRGTRNPEKRREFPAPRS